MRVVRHRRRLPREAMDARSLDVLKARRDGSVNNQGGEEMTFRLPSDASSAVLPLERAAGRAGRMQRGWPRRERGSLETRISRVGPCGRRGARPAQRVVSSSKGTHENCPFSPPSGSEQAAVPRGMWLILHPSSVLALS